MKAFGIAALLAFAPLAAAAQSILTLHERQAEAICYRAPLSVMFQVSLPAAAGSGYRWIKLDGDAFEGVGDPILGHPAGGRMVAGGPQIQTLRFRSTEAGRHTLTLGYARPGGREAPVRTLSFCLDTPTR